MAVTKKFLKTKPEVQVTFEIDASATGDASKVFVLGDFAEWEPVELKKQKGGSFKTTLKLPTDKQDAYQFCYRYVNADGAEIFATDAGADGSCSNPYGGENSIISVLPA